MKKHSRIQLQLHRTEPPPVGQQTGVILPPTATKSTGGWEESGNCCSLRYPTLSASLGRSACVTRVSACVQAAGASGNQWYCDGRPGPASPTATDFCNKIGTKPTRSFAPLLDLHRPRRDRSSNRVRHYLGNVSAAASCQLRLDRHSNCGALLGHRTPTASRTSSRSRRAGLRTSYSIDKGVRIRIIEPSTHTQGVLGTGSAFRIAALLL